MAKHSKEAEILFILVVVGMAVFITALCVIKIFEIFE